MAKITLTLPSVINWFWGGSTAKLAIFTDMNVTVMDSSTEKILAVGTPGNLATPHLEYDMTVSGESVTASETIYIYSINDSPDNTNARYAQIGIYDSNGKLRISLLENFTVHSSFASGATLAQIENFNYLVSRAAPVNIEIAGSSVWGTISGTLSSQTDLQAALDAKVASNSAITGATKTKITYDAKGLVTGGADATTADIADSLNKRYVTDANNTKLGHISVTQAVDLDQIETRVNELDASVILKGTWDASAGTFPGSGAAQAGWSYIVSVGGTVDGQVFAANDRLIAITDNASTSTFASNWFKADYTDQVLSVNGQTGAVSLTTTNISEGSNLYFTDERAQDAIGGMIDSTLNYNDATPLLKVADSGIGTTQIANDGVTYAKLQNISATSRILGRKTAGSGDAEEVTLSELLDFVGSAAQGDILYRGSSSWTRLGAGTSGHYLQTQGTGANPQWASVPSATSPLTLTANNASEVPLTSKGAASQTANLLTFQNSAGTEVSSFSSSGIYTVPYAGSQDIIKLGSSGNVKICFAGSYPGLMFGLDTTNSKFAIYNTQGTYGTLIWDGVSTESAGTHVWLDMDAQHLQSGTAGSTLLKLKRTQNTGYGSGLYKFIDLVDGSSNRFYLGAKGEFAIFNGTAPSASVTDGVLLYAEDVAASSELKVRDEAGNITTLSPHNFSKIKKSEDMAWAFYSERNGKYINVDMLKVVRVLEQLSGEKLAFVGALNN